jgi:hypothetical protein
MTPGVPVQKDMVVIDRAALRRLALRQHERLAAGGRFVNNGKSCEICNGEWPDDQAEAHAVTCPLSTAMAPHRPDYADTMSTEQKAECVALGEQMEKVKAIRGGVSFVTDLLMATVELARGLIVVDKAEQEALIVDAHRWRAFLSSDRIKLWGWAGFGDTGRPVGALGYRHFGGEFWTRHGSKDNAVSQQVTEQARDILTHYADAIVPLTDLAFFSAKVTIARRMRAAAAEIARDFGADHTSANSAAELIARRIEAAPIE